MDIRLHLISGIDIPIPECQLVLHQPTITDISYLGETQLFSGLYTLIVDKKHYVQGKKDLSSITNFQIFMTIVNSAEGAEKKRDAKAVLELIFPGKKVSFTPHSIVLLAGDGMIAVDENNFECLQEVLKEVFCLRTSKMHSVGDYNPGNAEAQAIADKLTRGRQIAAAQKGEENTSVFVQYVSILTVGIPSMSMRDLLGLTVYQLYDLIERFSLYTNWDIDIRSRLAGGKPDGKPDNWMKNIH